MKAKGIIAGTLLSAAILSGCDDSDKPLNIATNRRRPNTDSVTAAHHDSARSGRKVETMTAVKLFDTLQKSVQPKQEHVSPGELYTIPMKRVQKGPLGTMKGLNHNLATLLGGKYADSLIDKYNAEIRDTLVAHNHKLQNNSLKDISVSAIKQDIKVPLVNPSLKQFFPESLDQFLQDNPSAKENIGADRTVVIVTRDYETRLKKGHIDTVKKHVLGYYVDGKLVAAQYVSAGSGKTFHEVKMVRTKKGRIKKNALIKAFTQEGVYHTNDNGEKKDSTYRSKTFMLKHSQLGSPMPYAIPVYSGVYFHTGHADGIPRSHECVRLPGRFAMFMYDRIKDAWVKVYVYNMYDKKLK